MDHHEVGETIRRTPRGSAATVPSVAVAVGLAALIGAAIVIGQMF